VLKDLPEFPEQSKPTRVNMVREIRLHPSVNRIEIHTTQIRELKALVSGAEPGDKFTFFCVFPSVLHLPNIQLTSTDSGHSDQQGAQSDLGDEDDLDEDEGALLFLPEVSFSDARSFSANHK